MAKNRIAYWMSDKKSQKVNWNGLEKICEQYGYELFKLNLEENIENQEPFCVFLHKLTDIIASANQGDNKSIKLIKKVENYIARNPLLIVIDPIPNVRQLLNRYKCYSLINSTNLQNYGIFTPNFCELTPASNQTIVNQLKNAGIKYPFICKPILGHGSRQAHEMYIIFNEKHLPDCNIPCVAQNFINHNAKLYKIFIVGEKYYFVERPSLKNFYPSDNEPTIYFDSSDVSKAGSKSTLCVLDPSDKGNTDNELDPKLLDKIANTLRITFGMDLLGVDIVIENFTRKYAIIDVNAYPGYDGFPNFYEVLLDCIHKKVTKKNNIL